MQPFSHLPAGLAQLTRKLLTKSPISYQEKNVIAAFETPVCERLYNPHHLTLRLQCNWLPWPTAAQSNFPTH
jgi:hypothetical protein